MSTTFNSLRPILWTKKFEETVTFYRNILGFDLAEVNMEYQWAALIKDGVELMISAPNGQVSFPAIGFTGSFYFNVNNVDELWETLKDQTDICYEIENFPWDMREFAIYDINGYILQFGQDLK